MERIPGRILVSREPRYIEFAGVGCPGIVAVNPYARVQETDCPLSDIIQAIAGSTDMQRDISHDVGSDCRERKRLVVISVLGPETQWRTVQIEVPDVIATIDDHNNHS